MSVTEKDSGIMDLHIQALQETALAENTYIFVRPTEFDSTILIRAGYATKSMDVHHKSSNWGPMAGFVPCDPAFSKKCEGKPNPEEHEHKHGKAHPVQLTLKSSLLDESKKIAFVTEFSLAPATGAGKLDFPWVVKRGAAKTGMAGVRARFETFQSAGGHTPEHKFCFAEPKDIGNKSTLFCLVQRQGEWAVYWVGWDGETGRLNPLRVFAYPQNQKLVPVTGDYDLWMVAPHFKHLDMHMVTRLEVDDHGSSAASGYTMSLIAKMNIACRRADNPVFNHGAESQNYDFTQGLDWNLAMFTSGGQSRMVRMNQMPGILGDLQQAGYLVVWNKRYGEDDARLMGKANAKGEKISEIRADLDGLYRQLAEFRSGVNPKAVAEQFQSTVKPQLPGMPAAPTPTMPGQMKAEIELMAKRFQTSQSMGTEQSRIYRFNRQLVDFLGRQSGRFNALTIGDFHPTYRRYDAEARRLQADLQRVMVNSVSGKGASNEAQLQEWVNAHRGDIETLKRYWA